MIETEKKGRPARIKGWMMPLGGLLLLQIFFIVCDMYSWSPYREFKPGKLFIRRYLQNGSLHITYRN